MINNETRTAVMSEVSSMLYALAEAQHGLTSQNQNTFKEASRKVAVLTNDASRRLLKLTN